MNSKSAYPAGLWGDIEGAVRRVTGSSFRIDGRDSVSGGCINKTLQLRGADGQDFFLKLNSADRLDMFEAEAEGLEEIRQSDSLRAPAPIASGTSGDRSWLVLEHIHFGDADAATSGKLGQLLATMHRTTASQFGWHRDNTIGATPQLNAHSGNWIDFFRDQRLGYQLDLAAANGASHQLLDAGQQLREQIDILFENYHPQASLLHGDLWGGNWSADSCGNPVIFDPAVYYGDREADIAMTELFGGFNNSFYQAYDNAWPREPGYATRRQLYNLYHVLNHFNLFGGSYAAQAQRMIDALLSEIY